MENNDISKSSPGDYSTASQKEREERIKQFKEKQNEERQRKLEELKAQALATQKFREQKEEERRKRIEDLRNRDNEKRHQVEERKKAIWEAEKERREYILRKNQEREQRLETRKRNERSQIQFAFGSSTPRMIDTENGSLWCHRRSTSITNVAYTGTTQLTRRSSERELGDSAKKRATSASGLDRQSEDESGDNFHRVAYRRKTDLMPTIPSPRDYPRSSLGGTQTPNKTPGLRSGEVTPRSVNTSRPGSAMSNSTTNSGGLVVKRTSTGQTRKPRPISIAVTGVSKEVEKPPIPKPTKPSRPSSTTATPSSKTATPIKSSAGIIKPSPSATPKSSNTPQQIKSPDAENANKTLQEKPTEVAAANAATVVAVANKEMTEVQEKPAVESSTVVTEPCKTEKTIINNVIKAEQQHTEESFQEPQQPQQQQPQAPIVVEKKDMVDTQVKVESVETKPAPVETTLQEAPVDMTASMIAKSRITTEEEAKAAIAERRRKAREEAERQAELERKRLEAEAEEERQRQLEEERKQKELEEETIRLAEEQKKLEEERLQQAIEEARKREEAERKRIEEEAKQKAEREEAERKAREDAEKQKAEMAEKLKQEEKAREERRKRVEAIMARTRTKGSANNTPIKSNDSNPDLTKSQIDSMSESMIEKTLSSEENKQVNNVDDKTPIATTTTTTTPQQQQPNVQQNPQSDYEQSVTEKENLLLSSFNKLNLKNNNSMVESNNNINLLISNQNGKSSIESSNSSPQHAPANDLIMDETNVTNGHDKSNSIDNVLLKVADI